MLDIPVCHQDVIFQTKPMLVTRLYFQRMHMTKCCHISDISARHSALLSHLLVITDSAQTSWLPNVECDKRKQSKKHNWSPRAFTHKTESPLKIMLSQRGLCWMASVRSYDMLWYNLAKKLPLGVSWDGFSAQQIMPQIKEFVLKLSQMCSYCAANSTSAGLKQLSQMKDEMLQKSILSHQTSLLTGLGFLHRSIRRWSKAAESCIFPAVTSKEVRQIVKSETGETGCTYDLLQSYWSSCTCFQEKNL